MARLVQISDCHLFADPQKQFNHTTPHSSLRQVLQNAISHRPDGIIVTGDISGDDSIESYANLFAMMDMHCEEIPWKVLPGNHDNNPNFDKMMDGYVLKANDVWSLQDVNIVGLDTRHKENKGKIRTTELLDVYTQLLKGDDRPWLIAMHHPPFALNGWMNAHECVNHQIFPSWLAKQKNVACVIHGHLHSPTHIEQADIPVLGAPSTCWQYSLGENYALAEEGPGFRIIDIDPANKLTTEVIRV
jgi:Icc protein